MKFPLSDHCDGKVFFNPDGARPKGVLDVIRWLVTGKRRPWPALIIGKLQPPPPPRVSGGEPRITVIGHSTVLIQTSGLNFLTDPIWNERASPVPWAGPLRRREPALRMSDLPPIDVILLSHNHYDHCDHSTLNKLLRQHRPRIITTLGVSRDLPRIARQRKTIELDWWQKEAVQPDVQLTCVPSKHFSARTPFDRNRTLWCGFFLHTATGGIYFAGDTSWGDHFQQIRERLGSPSVALLPIGAYAPRWFMSSIHMDPGEAVRAHRVLGARKSIGIHYGVFPLSDEGPEDPVALLRKELLLHPTEHPFVTQ